MRHDPFVPHTTPRRSGIPRIVGVIAIIFACLGLGLGALFTIGPLVDLQGRGHASAVKWVYAFGGLSLVLFVLHLAGGILACMYRTVGLRLLTGYAVGALALIVIDLVYVLGIAEHSRRITTSLVEPHVVYSLLAVPWPVIVLVLVNLRRAKLACR